MNMKNIIEQKAKRVAEKGQVRRTGDCFRVFANSDNEISSFNTVKRTINSIIACDCSDYILGIADDIAYRCGHIIAVKFAIAERNTETLRFASSVKQFDSQKVKVYTEKSNILPFVKKASVIRVDKDVKESHSQTLLMIDPVAKCLSDLVTGRQLRMIKEFATSAGVNAENLCENIWNLRPSELSRAAATAFIANLATINSSSSAALSVRLAA
jgi:predicted nucleic acid-binding Zn finger protein